MCSGLFHIPSTTADLQRHRDPQNAPRALTPQQTTSLPRRRTVVAIARENI